MSDMDFKRLNDEDSPPGPAIAEITLLRAPFGTFDIHGDGTFTDKATGLMWMQAPFGMTWDGQSFSGQATKLTWQQASEMFGEGPALPLPRRIDGRAMDDPMSLAEPDIKVSEDLAGYTRGSQRHSFAGFSDWRLPTVHECRTIAFMDERGGGEFADDLRRVFAGMDAIDSTGGYFWTATMTWKLSGILKPISKALRLFTNFFAGHSVCAWGVSLEYGTRCDIGADNTLPVVLVRNKMPAASPLSSGDYDRACEAFRQGRLIIQVRHDKAGRWMLEDKLIVSRDCSKKEFMKQATASHDNWTLAWETGLVDFFVLG